MAQTEGGSEDLAALRGENERLAAALQEEKDARAKEQQKLKEKISQKFDQMKAENSTKVEALNKELEDARSEAEEARRKLAEQEHSDGAHPQTNGFGGSDHAKEEPRTATSAGSFSTGPIVDGLRLNSKPSAEGRSVLHDLQTRHVHLRSQKQQRQFLHEHCWIEDCVGLAVRHPEQDHCRGLLLLTQVLATQRKMSEQSTQANVVSVRTVDAVIQELGSEAFMHASLAREVWHALVMVSTESSFSV